MDKEITIFIEELFANHTFGLIAAKNFHHRIYVTNLIIVYGKFL